MTRHILDFFFKPGAVAVVGASTKEQSIGFTIVDNLLQAKFPGSIYPINPNHTEILGLQAYPSLAAVGAPIDLAVIAIPINKVAAVIEECGAAKIPGAIIISAGGKEAGAEGEKIEADIMAAAGRSGVRYMGPNCMGILSPHNRLNASFASHFASSGSVALLSQSGAICSAVLDWARREKIGFSHFVSIGSMADLDFADMIDYLGNDSCARSIIIYMESMTNHRKFMSAARSVSRVKPIIVVKSGRSDAGAKAAASHTGALAGLDEAYNAAFRRAGIIRVDTISHLFSCAEALGRMKRPTGGNLGIITNAGGPAVMAVDALSKWRVEPAALSPETLNSLDKGLPGFWSRGNPVDVLGDATPERYLHAAKICLEAPELSGLVIILTPQAMTDPTAVAAALAPEIRGRTKPVFAVWMGGSDVAEGIRILNDTGIPTYATPEEAVDTFMQMYSYTRNLELLQETPPQMPPDIHVETGRVKSYIETSLKRGQKILTEIEAKAILSAYGIPINQTVVASSAADAIEAAQQIGFPVVMKIHSPDITHKSDVDGVRVNLHSAQEVKAAFAEITERAASLRPGANIFGVTVQAQVSVSGPELIIGCKRDPDFGPLILFGAGGVLTEIFKDSAIDLPPLNMLLARRLMERVQITRILKGYRNIPPADMGRLAEMLVRLSQLVTDFPEITELDINPLLISGGLPVAADARIALSPSSVPAPRHLIISPYPNQYEQYWTTEDGTPVLLRPMKPEDEELTAGLLQACSEETIYFRYFQQIKSFPHSFLIRFTQNDYDREMGIAAISQPPGPEHMMGVGRLIMTPERDQAEFAVIVADRWQGKGLGEKLMERVIEIARENGVKKISGDVLAQNRPMMALMRKLGFGMGKLEEGVQVVEMEL